LFRGLYNFISITSYKRPELAQKLPNVKPCLEVVVQNTNIDKLLEDYNFEVIAEVDVPCSELFKIPLINETLKANYATRTLALLPDKTCASLIYSASKIYKCTGVTWASTFFVESVANTPWKIINLVNEFINSCELIIKLKPSYTGYKAIKKDLVSFKELIFLNTKLEA